MEAGETDAELEAAGVGGDDVDISTSGRRGDSAGGAGVYIPVPKAAR